MRERERVVVTGILSILLLSWLGFLVHRSPRFAGSGLGAVFGISGAVLMLATLIYPIVKRVPVVRARVTKYVSLPWLLTAHVYAGILGPLLAIVHTGHKFDSWGGVSLMTLMLLVVVSGFAVRYLRTYVSHEIADKVVLLQTARGDLDSAWGALESLRSGKPVMPKAAVLIAGLASVGVELPVVGAIGDVTRIAESVADLEYAIRTHELLKMWFSRALSLHIALSAILYVLLALHIGSEIYFGLRWWQ